MNTILFLSQNQSAYKPCHSTETELLEETNDILLGLDRGHVSLLALLDLSAAFDTADHAIMAYTLQSDFGISRTALSWLKSYMFDRTQFVFVNNCCSDPVNLKYGVPQGSVLGPVRFVMYTRPLLSLIDRQCVSNQSFADDTQIYNFIPPSQIGSIVQNIAAFPVSRYGWFNINCNLMMTKLRYC